MTAYTNFVTDFPSRCSDLLAWFGEQAEVCDREVTLSLIIAAAGFVIPFERLKPESQTPHPSGDKEKYGEHARELEALMKEKILGSRLHRDTSTSWSAGKFNSAEGDPDSWPELNNPKKITKDKTVGNVLKTVRNALAHGSVYTKGNPIEAIIFVCENKDEGKNVTGYRYVCIPPREFTRFLQAWFALFSEKQISQELAAKIIDEAA